MQPAIPAITVIIPTLDEERRLPACLASIGQHPDIQVIVSDGGSRDATCAIAAEGDGIELVSGSPGRGPQLNRGAAVAAAPALLFLHADCRLPPGWRPAVLAALADRSVALVCFRLRTEPVDGPGSAWARLGLGLLDVRSKLALLLPYGDQGFAVRRPTFDAVGGFPDQPLMEDLELARRCRRVGAIRRLPLTVRTTARRFEHRPVAARVMVAVFPSLYRLGVSPQRLARWYGAVR